MKSVNPYHGTSPEECRVRPWFAINGDQTLRVNYPLSQDSLVYDIGGYEGDWSSQIYDRYRCRIEVFEPVLRFINILHKRFADTPKVRIHPHGLAAKDQTTKINLDRASSSIYKIGKRQEVIKLVSLKRIIESQPLSIDLMKINIEGGEYELLESLLITGLIKNVKDVQVQFHNFVPDAQKKRDRLQKELSKTHRLTYCYPWIWENWRRKI